jgi:predicted dehydrogenase
MRFLVIGIGHAGERHIKNLKLLGEHDILVYDKNIDTFRQDVSLPDKTSQQSRLEYMIDTYGVKYFDPKNLYGDIDAFIICTPPSSHMEYIIQGIQRYAHVFVEKPISNSLTYLDWVEQTSKNKGLVIQIGYQIRFMPGMQKIKVLIDNGRIKDISSIAAMFGQYLPDWHPGEDYKLSYTGHKSEGGGIILDASHEIDYVLWLINSRVKSVSCAAVKSSNLDIDTEDTAHIIITFENGVIAYIHLDMTSKQYTRFCVIDYDKIQEILTWNYKSDSLTFKFTKKYLKYGGLNGDPYVSEMQSFIDSIKNHTPSMVDVTSSIKVMEVIMAAKLSASENNRLVLIEEIRK